MRRIRYLPSFLSAAACAALLYGLSVRFPNPLTQALSPVNASPWELGKLAFWPCLPAVLALRRLLAGGESDAFNLGNGNGFSVLEMLEAARRVTGHPIPAQIEARRAGDPARLVASADKAHEILGWTPEYTSVEQIIADAWRWHQSHPHGYNGGTL